jgi:quinol monooxygenase YgiN
MRIGGTSGWVATVTTGKTFCLKINHIMVKLALLARLESKPGKERALADLLVGAVALARSEPATVQWFAFRIGPTTFGIFDTFELEEGRTVHLNGPIAAALMAKAPELLAQPPVIEKIDLLAVK